MSGTSSTARMPVGPTQTAGSGASSATLRRTTNPAGFLSECGMNSKGLNSVGRCLLIAFAALAPLSCKESLPTYVFPTHIMSLKVATIEQLSNRLARPGHQAVHMVLVGRNTFDEVFEDSVDIKGSVRIWWQRKPRRFRTITLSEQNLVDPSLVADGKMMLLPGQEFGLDFTWDLRTDDSLYPPSEIDVTNARR